MGLWAHLCKDGALIHLRTPEPCIKCAFSKSFHDWTYCGMNQLLDKPLAKPWAQVERPIMDVIQKHVGMGVGWKMGWVFGICRGKPLYTEQINPKILLYSTGNYFLYTMVNYSRKVYRRNGISLIVNKRVWDAVLGCNLKNGRRILVRFHSKPFSIIVIQACDFSAVQLKLARHCKSAILQFK